MMSMKDVGVFLLCVLGGIVIVLGTRAVFAAPVLSDIACVDHCHPMRARVVGDRCECLVGAP